MSWTSLIPVGFLAIGTSSDCPQNNVGVEARRHLTVPIHTSSKEEIPKGSLNQTTVTQKSCNILSQEHLLRL